jgi:hypothetical protein
MSCLVVESSKLQWPRQLPGSCWQVARLPIGALLCATEVPAGSRVGGASVFVVLASKQASSRELGPLPLAFCSARPALQKALPILDCPDCLGRAWDWTEEHHPSTSIASPTLSCADQELPASCHAPLTISPCCTVFATHFLGVPRRGEPSARDAFLVHVHGPARVCLVAAAASPSPRLPLLQFVCRPATRPPPKLHHHGRPPKQSGRSMLTAHLYGSSISISSPRTALPGHVDQEDPPLHEQP